MATIPGKLAVAPDGRVTGPASIGYSTPFPTAANTLGGSGARMLGVIMHTEVGFDHNVVAEFENAANGASATFSVRDDGHITQYVRVGHGDMAWAQMAGNPMYYSVEHEDKGHPETPLTGAQIAASAQLVECLSAFAGFALQEANRPGEQGYGTHYMGGAAWGGHTCPDVPPKPVRSLQRAAIIDLAKQIRAGQAAGPFRHLADGAASLAEIAAGRGTTAQHLAEVSARAYTPADLTAASAAKLPAGLPYYTSHP